MLRNEKDQKKKREREKRKIKNDIGKRKIPFKLLRISFYPSCSVFSLPSDGKLDMK
jgi:hypothetical protein